MKIENVIIGKDIVIGKDKLVSLQSIFSNLETTKLPTSTPFCLLISLRAENEDYGKEITFSVKIFAPDKKRHILLNTGKLPINQDVTLLYLKGILSFIQEGKHTIRIEINSIKEYEEAILNVKIIGEITPPMASHYLSSTASSSSSRSSSSSSAIPPLSR